LARQGNRSGAKELTVKAFYSRVWEEYADPRFHPITAAALSVQCRIVEEWARTKMPESILDLGCGPAPVVNGGEGRFLVCADLVQDMLLRIKEEMDVPVLCLDAQKLPFRDRCFDLIWCGLLVDHISAVGEWIQELCRVLKPGGTIGLACWERSRLPKDRYPRDQRMCYSTSRGEELSVTSYPTWPEVLEILVALDPAFELKSFPIVPGEYVLQVASARIGP